MDHRSFGYARVSSADQNLDRQLDAFAELGLDAVYEDKASGKDFDRPGWRRLKRRLRAGDVLYVLSIDRIGRNYDEIIAEWRELTRDRGVDIVVLDMPLLDTRSDAEGVTGAFTSAAPTTAGPSTPSSRTSSSSSSPTWPISRGRRSASGRPRASPPHGPAASTSGAPGSRAPTATRP